MKRKGFGQVEPNHLSAQRTGQIYAQLPAEDAIEILENGQYVKYDYANGVVNFTGEGEWMLVVNEIKNYDPRAYGYKDFAMKEGDYTPGSDTITHDGLGPFKGQMVPRVFKTNVGDIYTTNCLELANTDRNAEVEMTDLEVGAVLAPNENGFLATAAEGATGMKWQVVKVYTMPDGQPGVKLMRIE